jgi:hypothetical protein
VRRFKKIYYVPGLISACIIPILFWFYGNRKLNEPMPNVMDIGLPAKKVDVPNLSFEPYRNWDYKKIVVKPNTARQNSDLYVSEIKKLQQRNQKDTGIEFMINDGNSYDDLISILNDFIKTGQEYYILDLGKTNNFFAMVNYKDPNKIEEPCMLCNDNIAFPYQPNGYYKFQEFFSQLPKQAFYIIFGFLIFLNISMLSIKESFQNH